MLQALTAKNYNVVLSTLPRTVQDALECPPITELVRNGAALVDLEACLALEVAKTANLLTVGGNLRQGQSVEIAKMLVADYPNESLQDFCLCLRKGIKGAYGEIFRFDVLVIYEWFGKYLEEKYEAVEAKMMAEKDELYKPIQVANVSEKHQEWLDRLKEAVSGNKSTVHKMTEREIELEGQERPKANIHPYAPQSYLDQRELRFQWMKECTDPYTGKLKPGALPEEEWLKQQQGK